MRYLILALILVAGFAFAEGNMRVIKTIPQEMHFVPVQGVSYDGMYDYITTADQDVTGALYVSIDTPTYEDQDDGQGGTVRVKISNETVLLSPHASIWRRQTFAGWNPVGKPVPEIIE